MNLLNAQNRKHSSGSVELILVIVLVIASVAIGGYFLFGKDMLNTANNTLPEVRENPAPQTGSYLTLAPIVSGTKEVVITSLVFAEPGYVVIKEDTGDGNGEIIGMSHFIEAGTHTDVKFSTNRVVKDEVISISLYKDNGDKTFSNADVPVMDGFDNEILIIQVVGTIPYHEADMQLMGMDEQTY